MQSAPQAPHPSAPRARFGVGTSIAVLVLLAGTLVFAQLQRMADRAHESETLLAALGAHLNRMNGLEWEAIATHEMPARMEAEWRRAWEQADHALHALLDQPGVNPETEALESTFHGYASLLIREQSLIRQGRIQEAERLDAERVDPLYDFLFGSIAKLTDHYHERAVYAGQAALGGSLLTVLAALLAMGYLAWHAQSARRDAAVAQAEERVRRESEERYRDLFESNPHPMWVVDLETTRFLAVNSAASERYGYSRDEFLAMSLSDIRPFDPPELLARDAQIKGRSSHYHPPSRHRTKDRSVFQAEVACRHLEFAGRPAALSLIRDVSERLRLEGELRESHKLEAVARLAGGVAYDFNNILAGIGGFAQLLAAAFPDEEHHKERRYAEEIIASTRRAAALTQQLLVYSRRQMLRAEVLDLSKFLSHMQHTIQPVVGNGIRVELRRAADLWPVRIDPAQLDQVMVSLAGHARDAMPEGGTLTLESRNVHLDEDHAKACEDIPPGDYVTITLSYAGSAAEEDMPPDDAGASPHPQDDSLVGVGLAIVHGIVEQNGGSLTVERASGGETTFRLHIPRAPAESPARWGGAGYAAAVEEPSGNGRQAA